MTTKNKTKLTAKQEAFCMYYATPGSETENNGQESARLANYKGTDNTLKAVASENLTKPDVKKRIDKIKAAIAKKLEHNRTIAIKMLTDTLGFLEKAIADGSVPAVTARIACVRELNAISNLHSNTSFVTTSNKDEAQSDKEIKAGEEAAKIFKLRLANG